VIRVKICGVVRPDDIAASVAAGADYVGFNFIAGSPRFLSFDAAAALAGTSPAASRRIGLVLDAADDLISKAVATGRLAGLQLHGSETPERVAAVKRLTGIEVWKAVGVRTRADVLAARAFAGVADRILFDAKTDAALPGGMGVRFDWRLLAGIDPGAPWGLAGGLDASTVADAIAIAQPPLVDVASGVEDAPGVKSPAKIRAFIEAVRSA
jgi:phosphoribosylanthranilate isomerase